jgi:Zn-dependent protease
MFFTVREFLDVIVMTLAVGYIFSDLLSRFRPVKDPLLEYAKGTFTWENLKFSIFATVPAVLLHELAHKFLAIYFGMQATFHAAYYWLGLGVILKMMSFPFIFFVPAFVSITGVGSVLQHSLVAFAGPATNALIWLLSSLLMKVKSNRRYYPLLFLTGKVNMFLFILNLLPIPSFDGFTFFSGLYDLFVG